MSLRVTGCTTLPKPHAGSASARKRSDDASRPASYRRSVSHRLVSAGLREELPKTQALAKRPFRQGAAIDFIPEMANEARDEIHAKLEYEGDRAHADDQLGS